MMNSFEIYIAYVSWKTGGKKRPVLILERDADTVTIYGITSQCENKSTAIRTKYYKIIEWQQAGLTKQSYIDTNTKIKLPLTIINENTSIGRLSETDKLGLIDFLIN